MKKNDLISTASSASSVSIWIRFLAFCLVFSAGIISIIGSLEDDPNPGIDVVWEFDLEEKESGSSPAIDSDGTIYVGGSNGSLYAIERDGKLKWRFATGGEIVSSPAVGRDGTIYVGSRDNNFYAIKPDGEPKWLYSTGGAIRSSPAIGRDGTVYVGSDDTNLYALDPDGEEKWIFSTGGKVDSSPAIGCDGTVYVGGWDQFLYAIDPDGEERWKYAATAAILSSPAIGSDGIIYVGSADGSFYAVNPQGLLKWKYEDVGQFNSSPAIGSDGTLYIGSDDGTFEGPTNDFLYAISSEGSLRWRYKTLGLKRSSPAIGNDGTIYVGGWDLHAINPDGSRKQLYDLPDIESSPSIGSDGTLYVLADSKLVAVDVASGSLGDTAWPMFRHDLRHTGTDSDTRNPANVNATAGDSQVVISWDSTSDASTYNIYWSTSPGVTTSDTRISGVTSPQIVGGLTNGTTYYFATTAESTCGESGLSSETSATPQFAGAYSVFISPGDGPMGNICPDMTVFTANVTGGASPYTYSWIVKTDEGAGFNTTSPVDEQTLEVCPWDSVTRGTIEVTVTDSDGFKASDVINVSAF